MTLPDLGWVATLAVTLTILATASALTTALLVQDEIPLGPLRQRIIAKWPPPRFDFTNPNDPIELKGSRFGYWWTCPRCAGVWSMAVWFGAFLVWPTGTLVVAFPFAAAQIQRWWNART